MSLPVTEPEVELCSQLCKPLVSPARHPWSFSPVDQTPEKGKGAQRLHSGAGARGGRTREPPVLHSKLAAAELFPGSLAGPQLTVCAPVKTGDVTLMSRHCPQ